MHFWFENDFLLCLIVWREQLSVTLLHLYWVKLWTHQLSFCLHSYFTQQCSLVWCLMSFSTCSHLYIILEILLMCFWLFLDQKPCSHCLQVTVKDIFMFSRQLAEDSKKKKKRNNSSTMFKLRTLQRCLMYCGQLDQQEAWTRRTI